MMLRKALRDGTLNGKLTPVHCGSSKNFHGVQLLLDAVVDYLPSPAERRRSQGIDPKTKEKATRKPEPKEPFSGLAFKTVSEATGDLVYVRIYSGELQPKDEVLNTDNRQQRAHGPHLPHDGRPPRSAWKSPGRARSWPSSA